MSGLARFARLVLAFCLAVILWGAIVRATGSGAGCGNHWPLCNGQVVPRAPAIETRIEFAHRVTSGLALIGVLALAIAVFRLRPAGHPARAAAVWSALFMVSEAGVGAALVLFRMVADNASMARAMFMATHLINTFFLLAALTLTAWFTNEEPGVRLRGQGGALWAVLAGSTGLLLAGVSGAVAALGDTLFPSHTLADALRAELSQTGHLLIRLRLLHPALAVGAATLAVWLGFWLKRWKPLPMVARFSDWTAVLALVQLGLGGLDVLLLAPVWLQVVHLLTADLVWIAWILLGAAALNGNAGESLASG